MSPQEKLNIKEARDYTLGLYNKYKSIRKHYLNFAIISLVFASLIALKFGFWYVYIPFSIVSCILLIVRYNYKFKLDVSTIALFGTYMIEEGLEKDITDDEIVKLSEKKVEDFERNK